MILCLGFFVMHNNTHRTVHIGSYYTDKFKYNVNTIYIALVSNFEKNPCAKITSNNVNTYAHLR